MAGLRERFPPRRVARLLGWNVLILLAGLVLIAGGAEVYLRLTVPFRESVLPVRVEPGVGVIRPPHAEVRYTSGRDFWQVSRANSLGFLDREPPSPERAAASCHVTLIGDSFVEGPEVPLEDRVQVRLEELAAREAPELDVTTSAFAFRGTGQINQLPFYDSYARRLSPDVVALVFARNDFHENSLALQSWLFGRSPDHPPWLSARRGPDGEWELVPPASSLEALRANLIPRWPVPPEPAGRRIERKVREWSYFADWLWARAGDGAPFNDERGPGVRQRLAWVEVISAHPRHADFAEGWDPSRWNRGGYEPVLDENPAPLFAEALDAMAFALEQFRRRAERDGAELVIFATHDIREGGDLWAERLHEVAARVGAGIPVISQYDHMAAVGGEVWQARWEHDYHWNATGHRWAAEAIWEWLKANPEVCG